MNLMIDVARTSQGAFCYTFFKVVGEKARADSPP
jgi:hypothetical protein